MVSISIPIKPGGTTGITTVNLANTGHHSHPTCLHVPLGRTRTTETHEEPLVIFAKVVSMRRAQTGVVQPLDPLSCETRVGRLSGNISRDRAVLQHSRSVATLV